MPLVSLPLQPLIAGPCSGRLMDGRGGHIPGREVDSGTLVLQGCIDKHLVAETSVWALGIGYHRAKGNVFISFISYSSIHILCHGLMTIALLLLHEIDEEEKKYQINKESRVLDTQCPYPSHQCEQMVFLSSISTPAEKSNTQQCRMWVSFRVIRTCGLRHFSASP